MMRSRVIVAIAGVAMGVALSGCSKGTLSSGTAIYTTAPSAIEAMPAPNSPAHAVNALTWSMNHVQWKPIADLLPEDFQFAFATTDSAGNAFAGRALDRQQALLCLQHLLETGTATAPPASSIQLILDVNLVFLPDSRPGKEYPWHQETRTTVTLSIDAGDELYRVLGYTRFFLVRGDSAAIPPDLAAQGFKPDPHRWWIERVEDETQSGVGGLDRATGTLPSRPVTWGSVLALYH